MQLSNVRRIIIEDFKQEDRETVGKLATILNSFMEEVVTLSQGNISTENLTRSIQQIDIQVNENGVPKGITQINTGLGAFSGHKIINVQSFTGGDNVISTPYMDCQYQGSGIIKINKFLGLPPNKKLRVTIEFIA